MKNLLILAVVAMGLCFASLTKSAQAHEHQHVQYSTNGQRYMHVEDHHRAHSIVDQLKSFGCTVHMHHNAANCYEICYSCGTLTRFFDCDVQAHNFCNRVRNFGMTAKIIHHHD